MQKGTADKWIRVLKEGGHKYGCGQLRYNDCFCAMGVLLDLINPNAWELAWDGVSYTWEGEQFYLPERIRKGSKIKSREMFFETNNGFVFNLADISDREPYSDRRMTLYYLEKYYEQM